MIEFSGPIPLSIHPFYWVFTAIIGWLFSGSLAGMLIWMGIILVSVLFHEFGHAITAVLFKQKARIQLVALGGVTMYNGPKLKFWQQFLITFNGPLFGFLLFCIATVLLKFNWPLVFTKVLLATQMANLFWTVMNLLPVLPLDGGQLLRIVLEASFGVKGFKASLLIGAVIAVLFALYFFLVQAFLIGAFFFMFAFQSFDSWRKSRYLTPEDRDDGNKEIIIRAEEALQAGKSEEAKQLFTQVREKVSEGVLFYTATQYLAFLNLKEEKREEAYELLLPIKDHIDDEAMCLLHELAAEHNNGQVVIDLSTHCYQIAPSQKMALNNARAFAILRQGKLAGGWLQTAWQFGGLNVETLLQEEAFEPLKGDPEFMSFIEDLK